MGVDSIGKRKFERLVDLLQAQAQAEPDTTAYLYLGDGENVSATLTYGELDRQARRIGAHLQELARPGDRAVMLYPQGLEPVAAFLGCLYAGVAPVPSFPLTPGRPPTLLAGLLKDAETNLILTTRAMRAQVEPVLAALAGPGQLRWGETDDWAQDASAKDWRKPELLPGQPVLLLYTSGSTSAPKGVVITNRNALENMLTVQRALQINPGDTMVVWAPLYHGTGLLSAGLTPLTFGTRLVLMPPLAVMEQPLRWLRAITTYRAAMASAPNFLYQYCVDRIPEADRAGLELSSWRNASSGGEPIRMSTLEQFGAAYEPYGFRRDSWGTGYGLSESSIVGTVSRKITFRAWSRSALQQHEVVACDPDDPDAWTLVSVGKPFPTLDIRIVDPFTCVECAADRVGEIWMAGPTVAAGYWRNPEETERAFHAHIAGTDEGPFLRTGDLGFFYEDELYIAGRLKETIIVHGRNYYAQDIEAAVAGSHPAVQPAAAAAFSVPVGAEEQIVLFQELKQGQEGADVETVSRAIRRAAADALGLSLYAVVLVKPGSLPRTGMGKIQRYAVRDEFLKSQHSKQLV